MRILALETSGVRGSVALWDGADLTEQVLPDSGGTLQTLAPAIDALLAGERRVDVLAVTRGPGSFTGLRLGLTTAKMLGWAWQVPVVGLDTLEVIARQQATRQGGEYVVPVINAFRGQVFSAVWQRAEQGLQLVADSQVVDAQAWVNNPLHSLGVEPQAAANCLVAGPGLQRFAPSGAPMVTLAEEQDWHPRAAEVALQGAEKWRQGHALPASQLLPNYLRDSAAVEQARERA